ncbi:putative short-chain dehydrogenases/reductase [Laetiporus sulphureus 93-53]|uniref:Putative short-chain dehydrogenases/reductase n=1 Tax=Laetiporus sulphureus 93-53 TaxID=1314785 RepID=A0A165CUF1_9APHY|nr:putative short-chain dehydrogenases/reductase [Laetiporus sulphureus 93-53]KZT03451.1 putative short-chain dehydrogenases/reductase [Laetiporus sulphureus 93-53]
MPSYLITGASRGIGLALAQELLADSADNFVVATARRPEASEGLRELAGQYPPTRLARVQLDVTDEVSLDRAVEEATALLPEGLDYLISNAATDVTAHIPFEDLDLKLFDEEFKVNVRAPLQVVRKFLPLIRKAKIRKIVHITSDLGSLEIAPKWPGMGPTYSLTKAALNMLARKWAVPLSEEGITTVLIHPGFVASGMSGSLADTYLSEHGIYVKKITPRESAYGCVKVFQAARLESAVRFSAYDGREVPW